LMTCSSSGMAQSQPSEDSVWEVSLGAGAMYHPTTRARTTKPIA
jgi:hypothetical protein